MSRQLPVEDADLIREFVPNEIFIDAKVSRNTDGTLVLVMRPRHTSRVLRIIATVTEAVEL